MNQERRRLGGIYRELDAAFATVQAAKLRREVGYEDAQNVARECVARTAASINKQMLGAAFSQTEIGLVEARLRALIGAAARVPGSGAIAAQEQQPSKAAAMPGR